MEYQGIIIKSFNNFIDSIIEREEKNDKILSNIIIAGGAWEHWFKFELISQLSKSLNHSNIFSYSIEPEKKFIDISILKNDNNNWDIESIIELKISANWHIIDKQLDKMVADIDKLENYTNLSNNKYLLIFNTFAKPRHEIVKWIDDQVLDGIGEADYDIFMNKITEYIKKKKNRYPITILNSKLFSNNIFEKVIISGSLIQVGK